jgi:hypothetical protein
MREYSFSYYENKEKKQGKLKISDPVFDETKKSYVVDVYCSIDKRSYKIFGVDEKHSLELAQKFFNERYKNYRIKSKDI